MQTLGVLRGVRGGTQACHTSFGQRMLNRDLNHSKVGVRM